MNMKNFCLPEILNKKYIFKLEEIEDIPISFSKPLIIKKNNQLFS